MVDTTPKLSVTTLVSSMLFGRGAIATTFLIFDIYLLKKSQLLH